MKEHVKITNRQRLQLCRLLVNRNAVLLASFSVRPGDGVWMVVRAFPAERRAAIRAAAFGALTLPDGTPDARPSDNFPEVNPGHTTNR